MALFKILRGKREALDNMQKTDGYAYFCTDDGSFWIDYKDAENVLHRKSINESQLAALEAIDHDAYIEADKDVIDNLAWGSFGKNGIVKVAGLYQTGTDTMVKSWRKLLAEGIIHVDNGTISTNSSSDALTGDLILSNDDSVTSISSLAFENCSGLTSVTIPNNITSIGFSAFQNCTSLTEITLPFIGATKDGTSNTHFGYIFGADSHSSNANYVPASLTKVTITGGSSIGNYAFNGCTSLTSVEIEGSVTSIGNSAFRDCSNLTSVVISDSVTSIGGYAFNGCANLTNVVVPNGVTSIGYRAFIGCTSLTSITIPDSVTSVLDSAFESCHNLTSVYITDIVAWCNISFSDTYANPLYYAHNLYLNNELVTELVIPDSVTSIGDYVFNGCTSLTSVTIPDSVTSIGYRAFVSCTNLTSITIPDSVTSIGEAAFYDCTSLTSITIPDSVTSIGAGAFNNCTSLTSVTIPDSVTSIGNLAFAECRSLTSVTIPDSVTSIGDYVFWNCRSLTSVTIPDRVTSIGYYTFKGCRLLTTITIPENVTSIGNEAFYNCTSLTSMVIGDNVTSIGNQAFYNCTSLTSVYYKGTVENWNAITIGSDNTYLTNATRYYYSETEPAFNAEGTGYEGNWWYYDENGEINIWDEEEANSQGLAYTLNDDGNSYSVTGIGTCTDTNIIIPSAYNELPVTTIGSKAFSQNKTIVSVAIPDSVTSIDWSAFYQCTKLTSVAIGDSVTSIGRYAFNGCDNLTSVEIPDSVTSIGDSAFEYCDNLTSVEIPDSVTSIGEEVFHYCRNLTSITVDQNNANYKDIDGNLYTKDGTRLIQYAIGKTETVFTIPDSVTSIGEYAFAYCNSLTSMVIPDSVTSIGYEAFYECNNLTSVEIPDSITLISGSAFASCDGLTSITVDQNNANYKDIDGNLYTKDGTTLIQYAIGKTETVFTIPDSVTSIRDRAFAYCNSLTSVVIPDSVTSIGVEAFVVCYSLTKVYYRGTEEQWNEITIGHSNSNLTNATRYYYSETEPTLNAEGTGYEGNWWYYDENGEVNIWDLEWQS